MDLGDLGAAIAIAFTYFTIIYITGLGGLYSERSGIVNIGLEGMMIIGTVTGSWGTGFFTNDLGWGQPWGPLMGLLVGIHRRGPVRADPRRGHDHVPRRPDRLRRRHQPGGDRARAVPLPVVLRSGDPIGLRVSRSCLPSTIPGLSSLPWGLGSAFEQLSPMVIVAFLLVIPVVVFPEPDAVGASPAVLR